MTPTRLAVCNDLHTHDDQEPGEYVAWHLWAEEMTRTHTQHRCPRCSRFKIWLPKRRDYNPLLAQLASGPVRL